MHVNMFIRPLIPFCTMDGKEGKREIRVSNSGDKKGSYRRVLFAIFAQLPVTALRI